MVTFYIDSAVRNEVTELLASGLFGGVTTNPAILDKAGLTGADIPDVIAWATEAGADRVFVQSWGATVQEIVDRGVMFRAHGSHVVVKVPMSRNGIGAARILSRDGDVLVTAIHGATQVLPVMVSGASFVAPFIGRMTAVERDGVAETISLQNAIDGTNSQLKVLAGSLRTPEQILELATAGVKHMTFAPAVWDLFFEDGPTELAVENFERLSAGS